MSILLASIACCLLCCSPPTEQPQQSSRHPSPSSLPLRHDFAMHRLWDDGLAEVATYTSTRAIYGASRTYDYVMVTVKEDFNREFDVKTDSYDRRDVFTVFKVNLFARIPTDNYPYHFLTSLFVPRVDVGTLHKLTSSSQEWCGNTFKHVRRQSDSLWYSWDSYWDGEGVGRSMLDGRAMFEDQLFFTLRALDFRDGLRADILLYPSVITSKAALASPQSATVAITADTLAVPASVEARPCWHVSVVPNAGPRLDYWFGIDFPHVLYRFVASDGRSMTLSAIRRAAYWLHESR